MFSADSALGMRTSELRTSTEETCTVLYSSVCMCTPVYIYMYPCVRLYIPLCMRIDTLVYTVI